MDNFLLVLMMVEEYLGKYLSLYFLAYGKLCASIGRQVYVYSCIMTVFISLQNRSPKITNCKN